MVISNGMNSELEVLKKIWENNEETYIGLISNQLGLSSDYIRFLCNCLKKKEQLKPIKGKRDWYEITAKGKKELSRRGIIKPEISRKVSKLGKVLSYLPAKRLKVKLPQKDFLKAGTQGKDKLIEAEEKKLNLGEKIEKAVAFLRNL